MVSFAPIGTLGLLSTFFLVTVHGSNVAAFSSIVQNRGSRVPFHRSIGVRRWSAEQKVAAPETQEMMKQDALSSTGYFDVALWEEYETALRTVVSTGRVMRKEVADEVAPAIDCLLRNEVIVPIQVPLETFGGTDYYREAVREQRDLFLQKSGLSQTQYEFAMRTLTYLGDNCAKRRLPGPIHVAWHKLKEGGMVPRENCISTYLFVLGLDETSDLSAQVAAFHDLLYEPNEKTITLRVKSLVAKQDAAGALNLLNSLPENDKNGRWKRHRTYLPILALYCSQGDMGSALRLYRQMQNSKGVIFEPDTYALLIGAFAENGYFRRDSEPVEGAEECGFSASCGPEFFDELATEMANDILELNDDSASILYNAFVEGFKDLDKTNQLKPLSDGEELQPMNEPVGTDEVVVSRVSVNETTAVCPRTNIKLRLLKLEENQRHQVHDTLLEMAAMQYEEYREILKARHKQKAEIEDRDYPVRELSRFSQWLTDREGEPFSAIVDGPNVAYFGRGNVDYSQVEMVVKTLEKMNERPLVIMPQKYVAKKFFLNSRMQQELTDEDMDIIRRLEEGGKMYTVPSKCLDDYYWMLASVSDQAKSRNGLKIHVSTSESNGRFPGLRPMLITNDQMRDHKLELLEPRLFRRWCSCHIVNYNITSVDTEDDETNVREVDFCAADFFSREIQGNPTSGSSSTTWHFPVSEWDEHDRLCIRIP